MYEAHQASGLTHHRAHLTALAAYSAALHEHWQTSAPLEPHQAKLLLMSSGYGLLPFVEVGAMQRQQSEQQQPEQQAEQQHTATANAGRPPGRRPTGPRKRQTPPSDGEDCGGDDAENDVDGGGETDVRVLRRKASNRESARRSRERKRAETGTLAVRAEAAEGHVVELRGLLESARSALTALAAERDELVARVAALGGDILPGQLAPTPALGVLQGIDAALARPPLPALSGGVPQGMEHDAV